MSERTIAPLSERDPKEDRRQAIKAQLAENDWSKQLIEWEVPTDRKGKEIFFENFIQNLLPEEDASLGNNRRLPKITGTEKTMLKKILPEADIMKPSNDGSRVFAYSRLKLEQTPEEFFDTVDIIMEEEKVEHKTMQRLWNDNTFMKKEPPLTPTERTEAYNQAEKVYVDLRLLGYNSYPDLDIHPQILQK